MKEVIKSGKMNIRYFHKCGRCDCEFTFTINETEKKMGEYCEEWEISCPECLQGFVLNELKPYRERE